MFFALCRQFGPTLATQLHRLHTPRTHSHIRPHLNICPLHRKLSIKTFILPTSRCLHSLPRYTRHTRDFSSSTPTLTPLTTTTNLLPSQSHPLTITHYFCSDLSLIKPLPDTPDAKQRILRSIFCGKNSLPVKYHLPFSKLFFLTFVTATALGSVIVLDSLSAIHDKWSGLYDRDWDTNVGTADYQFDATGVTVGEDNALLTQVLSQRQGIISDNDSEATLFSKWIKWLSLATRPTFLLKHVVRFTQLLLLFLPPLSAGMLLIVIDYSCYRWQAFRETVKYSITSAEHNDGSTTTTIMTTVKDKYTALYQRPQAMDQLYRMWWDWLKITLKFSGATFIKLGQYLSSRPDLLSPAICDILADLQHDTDVHAWLHTVKTLEKELGPNWSQYITIQAIDQEPVGSGSIAQVYRGMMNVHKFNDFVHGIKNETENGESTYSISNDRMSTITLESLNFLPIQLATLISNDMNAYLLGRETDDKSITDTNVANNHFIPVAIKILHPQARPQITQDLQLLFFIMELFELIPLSAIQSASPVRLATEFSRLMLSQLDLRQEQRNLDKFRYDFKHAQIDASVMAPTFPTPLIASQSCLVETFHTGVPMGVIIDLYRSSLGQPLFQFEENELEKNKSNAKMKHLYTLLDAYQRKYDPNYIPMLEDHGNSQISQISQNTQTYDDDDLNPPIETQIINLLKLRHHQHHTILHQMNNQQFDYFSNVIAEHGLHTFLMMLLAFGFFHADLHAGNLIVDMGFNTMEESLFSAVMDTMVNNGEKTNDFINRLKNHYNHPQIDYVNSRLDNHYFTNTAWDPEMIYPTDVFGYIHSIDTRLHRAYSKNPEMQFNSKYYANKLPQSQTKPKLVCLDAGMATALSEQDKRFFNDLYYNIAAGKGYKAAAIVIEGAKPMVPRYPEDLIEFYDDIQRTQNIFNHHRDNELAIKEWQAQRAYRDANFFGKLGILCDNAALSIHKRVNAMWDHMFKTIIHDQLLGLGEENVNPDSNMVVGISQKQHEIPLETICIDGEDIHLYNIPYNPLQTKENRTEFIKNVGKLIHDTREKGMLKLPSTEAVRILSTLATEAQKDIVRMDSCFVGVIVATLCIEGVSISIGQDIDVVGPGLQIIATSKLKEAEKRVIVKAKEAAKETEELMIAKAKETEELMIAKAKETEELMIAKAKETEELMIAKARETERFIKLHAKEWAI